MSISISFNAEKSYLHYISPRRVDVKRVKERRRKLDRILKDKGVNRLILDLRNIDEQDLRVLDIDTLAKDFEDDIPSCKNLAILRNPTKAMQHFENVHSLKDGIEIGFFEEFKAAENWLCTT